MARRTRFGTPLNPAAQPPPPGAPTQPLVDPGVRNLAVRPAPVPQAPDFGAPVDPRVPGTDRPLPRVHGPITLIGGMDTREAPPSLPPGVMPVSQNWAVRDGGIEPRFPLNPLGTSGTTNSSATLLANDTVMGMAEYSSTTGARYAVAISSKTLAYLTSSWASAVYTGTFAPSGNNSTNLIDTALVYDPTLDEFGLVFTNSTNSAFWWDGVSSVSANKFSTLTNAPIAGTVANFDTRVVFGNINTNVGNLPQRVAWSDRALPQTYAAPGGGTADLLDATGAIQRLVEDGDRLIVFLDFEIWVGYRADYPFGLQFYPLDRTLGLGAPFSVAKTPRGIAFLGSDLNVYLLPRGGLPAPIGTSIWPTIRDEIVSQSQCCGAYDPRTQEYHLAYPIAANVACQRVWRWNTTYAANYASGAFQPLAGTTWTKDVHVHQISQLAEVQHTSAGTTFAQLVGSFISQAGTSYSDFAGKTTRSLLAGTSNGSVGEFVASATSDLNQPTDCRALIPMGNPNPSEKLYLKDLWIDYRADSASSLTINLSPDFGASFPVSVGVALPAATPSLQTRVNVGFAAVYPSVQLQHDQGQRFRIQRIQAITEEIGQGLP